MHPAHRCLLCDPDCDDAVVCDGAEYGGACGFLNMMVSGQKLL
jgi:hypothetical protein